MLVFDDNICECNDTKCSTFDYTWDNDGTETDVEFICQPAITNVDGVAPINVVICASTPAQICSLTVEDGFCP